MASVMGIGGGLVGPKSGDVENVLVFIAFFEGSKEQNAFYENEHPGEKWSKK